MKDKQELLLEQIKQILAIRKLMTRNEQETLRKIAKQNGKMYGGKSVQSSDKSQSSEENEARGFEECGSMPNVDKIFLPIIFVKATENPDSKLEVLLDEN